MKCEIVNRTNPSCANLDDGIIEVSATSCSSNFEFQLGNVTNNTGIFENLGEGTYTVVVTDETGCSATCSEINLRYPVPLECRLSSFADESCTGLSNGAVTVSASGGTGAYSYSLVGEVNETGVFTELDPGSYTVTVLSLIHI